MPHPEPLESLSGTIIALRDTFYELAPTSSLAASRSPRLDGHA